MLVDSHAHIDGPEFDEDREQVVVRARSAGIEYILNVGTGDPTSGSLERAVRVAELFPSVFAAVGIHPHDARHFSDIVEEKLRQLALSSSRVIAIGEIGLDFHYNHSPRDVQRSVFVRQLNLAHELKRPFIIHSRSADLETVDVLSENRMLLSRGGIMHCFSGSSRMAADVMELGLMISFAGNLTFKNAADLRDVAREVPVDRLLAETDCPYLTPIPYRGRRNEPGHVVETIRLLASLKGISFEEMANLTTSNFVRFFGLANMNG